MLQLSTFKSSRSGIFAKFRCSKTRVAPVKKLTIPRLELLSAITVSQTQQEVPWNMRSTLETLYVTPAALCWILGADKEWKQFVQNRVLEIRELVPAAS